MKVLSRLALAGLLVTATACTSTYYNAMEKFGVHKRDILVDRVQEGRDAQEEAKEQFQSALEAFKSVQAFDGGELESVYNKLNKEYERSESRVKTVQKRIESIESVSTELFKEWEAELTEYTNADLRKRSESQMLDTKNRYDELITAMRRAESKMGPVLQSFGDQVLFLKHNLNAKAISSLQGSLIEIEGDVGNLIAEMEASIAEADSFIATMEGTEG